MNCTREISKSNGSNIIKMIYVNTNNDGNAHLSILLEYFNTFCTFNTNYLLKIVSVGSILCDSKNYDTEHVIVKENLTRDEISHDIRTSHIGLFWSNNDQTTPWYEEYTKCNLKIMFLDKNINVLSFIDTNTESNLKNLMKNFDNQCFLNKKLYIGVDKYMYDKYSNVLEKKYGKTINVVLSPNDCVVFSHKYLDFVKDANCTYTTVFDSNYVYDKFYLLNQIYKLENHGLQLVICENEIFYDVSTFKFYKCSHNDTCTTNTNNQMAKTIICTNLLDYIIESSNNPIIKMINDNLNNMSSETSHDLIKIFDSEKSNVPENLIEFEPIHIPGQIFNHVFDSIFVINMEKDILKKQIFLPNNEHTGIDFTFFTGVHGVKDDECNEQLKSYTKKPVCFEGCHPLESKLKRKIMKKIGQFGYLKSMINIFEYSVEQKFERIIIFDDDAVLDTNFNIIFNRKMQLLKNSHIVRLGASDCAIRKNKNVREPYYGSIFTDGSFGVCYKSICFKHMINASKKYNIPFDSGPLNDYRHTVKTKTDYTVDAVIYPFLSIADVFASEIGGNSQSLYGTSVKYMWDLCNFRIVSSLRKVSIILVVYNCEHTVVNTLISLKNQTYKNIEIVIVNDCSTDNTGCLIEQFINDNQKYLFNPIIYKKNDSFQGVLKSRALGTNSASGHFYAFQEQNSYSLSTRIETQMDSIIKKDVKISFSGHHHMQIPIKYTDDDSINYLIDKEYGFDKNCIVSNDGSIKIETMIINGIMCKKYNIVDNVLNFNIIKNMYHKEHGVEITADFVINNLDKNGFIFYTCSVGYVCDTI